MASMTMRVRAAGATRDIKCAIFWEIEIQLRVPGWRCQVPFCGQLSATARSKGEGRVSPIESQLSLPLAR